jgi:RNA polymerase sigma-70 factor (ECF subfamily)
VIERSDEALLAAHLRGDRDAFGELVARHERRVYGLCLRILGNREDAEDAAQEAFVAALRRAATFRQAAAFSTWLYRIAVNAATDQARRRARVRALPLDEDLADRSGPVGRDPGEEVVTAVVVQAALTRVAEEFRVAVVLCDLYRVPYAEAAQILEVPVGTVKSRVFRGRLALAAELEGRDREPPAPGDVPGRGTPAPAEPGHLPGPGGRGLRVAGGPGTGALSRASEPTEPERPSQE